MAAPSPGALVSSGDELCREYLAWRGCSASLRAFDEERSADRGAGLSADRLTELIFGTHVAGHDAAALCGLLDFLQSRFYSRLGEEWAADTRKLESSVLRLFVVRALQAGRRDKVLEVRAGVYARCFCGAVPCLMRPAALRQGSAAPPGPGGRLAGAGLDWMMRVSCCCLALTALGVAT
jgi:hypothetical protein